jgi:PAS domain S-box-containing protein
VLFVVIAALDYLTGYEIRLPVLYLLPIALVTWTRGRAMGHLVVASAAVCWLVSFHSANNNSRFVYFLWEGAAMTITFAVIVELLSRLRLALAQADARFLRVLEELFDGVYVVDPATGRIIYANRRFATIVGQDPLRLDDASLARRFAAELPVSTASVTSQRAEPFEICEVRDAQSDRWYLLQAGPIPWTGGRTATLRVLTDISTRKRAELVQRELEESAHHTARLVALGEVAATLTHEINQPLTAISTYVNACARLIEGGHFDAVELRGVMEECRDQALRAGRIVNRMRDFIRRRRVNLQRCDFRDVIAEAVQLTQADLRAAGVAVEVAHEASVPPIRGDRVMLVQVLVNLIQNAIDAVRGLDPERRRITIEMRRGDGGHIRVSVEDRGDGVPAAVGERLFEPFCTTKPGGIGLGLSICRTVIQAHSGSLWHEPLATSGSAFRFELPGGGG